MLYSSQLVSHGYRPAVFACSSLFLPGDVDERSESDEENGSENHAQDHGEREDVA